ncbi:MAG: hypothetical protein ABEH88_04195 [Halobacteriales archaeon]
MQRRAAAAYAGLLLLIAVGAYVMVGVAEEPAVTVENPDYTLEDGDDLTISDRTYTVSEVSGSADAGGRTATLTWTNASEKQTATLDNGSELPVINVTWPGQTARTESTFANGSAIQYDGNEYTAVVENGSVTLVARNVSFTFAVGDALTYRDTRMTVIATGNGSATLAGGDSYNVSTRTVSNGTFTFRESFNVSAILRDDPAVKNETETFNGTSHVVYTNDTIQPLAEYLPDPETKNFTEGDSFGYDTPGSSYTYVNVTVDDVDAERVLLSWRGPVTHEVTLEHGANVTLGPDERLYVAHFPNNGTVELTSDVGGYQSQLALQESYKNRTDGLWGIVIISGLGGVFLIGASYLPSRY